MDSQPHSISSAIPLGWRCSGTTVVKLYCIPTGIDMSITAVETALAYFATVGLEPTHIAYGPKDVKVVDALGLPWERIYREDWTDCRWAIGSKDLIVFSEGR